MMLGLSQGWALGITTAILLGYVTLGGRTRTSLPMAPRVC